MTDASGGKPQGESGTATKDDQGVFCHWSGGWFPDEATHHNPDHRRTWHPNDLP